MRNKLLIVLLTFASIAYAQMEQGLKSHYSFNGGERSRILDQSGNNNNGMATNLSAVEDRFGNKGYAVEFKNFQSAILLPDSFLLDSAQTISLWVNTKATDGVIIGQQNTPILESNSANQWVPQLYVRQDSQLNANFWRGSTGTIVNDSVIINDSVWHHIVLTGNTDSQYVYIDNKLVGRARGINRLTTMVYNQIGTGYTNGSWPSSLNGKNWFTGLMDDIRIYDIMIDSAKIDSLFNESDPKPIADTAIIANYSFNDSTEKDFSGNDNDGVKMGVFSGLDRFNNEKQAMVFDDESGFKIPDSLFLHTTRSISMWFKTGSKGVLFGQQNSNIFETTSAAQYVPVLYVRDDSMLNAGFWTGVTGTIDTSMKIVNDAEWHHVVLTASPAGQQLYIDNRLAGTSNYGINVLTSMVYNQIGVGFTSGSWPSSAENRNYFEGSIDDIMIYNRVLTPYDVDTLFAAMDPGQLVELDTLVTDTTSDSTVTSLMELEKSVIVYPNPSNGIVYLDASDNSEIFVYDLKGQMVFNSIKRDRFMRLELTKGLYIIRILNGGYMVNRKVIIE